MATKIDVKCFNLCQMISIFFSDQLAVNEQAGKFVTFKFELNSKF